MFLDVVKKSDPSHTHNVRSNVNFFEALSLTRRGRDVSGRGRMDGCCDVKTPVRLGTPTHASGARDTQAYWRMHKVNISHYLEIVAVHVLQNPPLPVADG